MQNMSIVVDVLGKIFKTFARWKKFYPGSDFKLTLALTLSLTLGLGLGLFPGKTIGVVIWNQMQTMRMVEQLQEKFVKNLLYLYFFVDTLI